MASCDQPTIDSESGLGPVFVTANGRAYVKVRADDSVRAVVDLSKKTLEDYIYPDQYPAGPLRCDRSTFVPIFCTDCYGTRGSQYKAELDALRSSGTEAFLVGRCCVYGATDDDAYPESRKVYIVDNELSFSGACHPQPGTALFQHTPVNVIGTVKCYWHVHSRSTKKTFVYCCVSRDTTKYAIGVVTSDTAVGLSLGTVGDNAKGPVTQECSVVSWPMRPGCHCLLVSAETVCSTMVGMGFSVVKNAVLEAGNHPNESSPDTDPTDAKTREDPELQDAQSLRAQLTDRLMEVRVLQDVLEAVKIQNNLFSRLLKDPDADALFTLRGAKDFCKRTGTETNLCAGNTEQAAVTQTTRATGSSIDNATMSTLTQSQVDDLLKLLHQQQQQQPSLQDAQQLLYALQSQRSQPAHSTDTFHRRGMLGLNHLYPTNTGHNDGSFEYGTLTEEQRRAIAVAYNKEEAERQSAAKRDHDLMLESIRATVRDVLLKEHLPHVTPAQDHGDQTLQRLARETPYKRGSDRDFGGTSDNTISSLMRELRELTKELTSQKTTTKKHNGAISNEDPVCATDNDNGSAATVPVANEDHAAATIQQAGYTNVKQLERSRETREPIADFISAVVTKV